MSEATAEVDVSVCIASWNCRELLRACLESLLHQPQGVRVEVVVIDNASSDGADSLVEQEFPEAILVRNAKNVGFATANNQAAELARGRYLFFLNNDTVVPEFALRGLWDYAEAHPEAGIVGPRLRGGDGQVQISWRQLPTIGMMLHRTNLLGWTGLFRRSYTSYRRPATAGEEPCQVDVVMGAAMFIPARVFWASGGWDNDFEFGGEDLDLCDRIGRQHSIVYLPRVEITHYGRVSTRANFSRNSVKMTCGMARFFRKRGASWPALWAYKLAVLADAPIEIVTKGLQFLWRRAFGRREKAERSRIAAHAQWSLLTRGLGKFCKA